MATLKTSHKKPGNKDKLQQKDTVAAGFFNKAYYYSAPMFVKSAIEREIFTYKCNQNNIFQAAHP